MYFLAIQLLQGLQKSYEVVVLGKLLSKVSFMDLQHMLEKKAYLSINCLPELQDQMQLDDAIPSLDKRTTLDIEVYYIGNVSKEY